MPSYFSSAFFTIIRELLIATLFIVCFFLDDYYAFGNFNIPLKIFVYQFFPLGTAALFAP